MTIRNKLILAFGSIILFLIIVITLIQIVSRDANSNYQNMLDISNPAISNLERFQSSNNELNLLVVNLVSSYGSFNPSRENRIKGILDVEFPNLISEVKIIQGRLPNEGKLFESCHQIITIAAELRSNYWIILGMEKAGKGNKEAIKLAKDLAGNLIHDEITPLYQRLTYQLCKLQDFYKKENAQFQSGLAKSIFLLSTTTLIIGVVAILLGLIISLRITKSIVNPVIKLQESTSEISKGNYDLKIELNESDELGKLGKSFNLMTAAVQESFNKVENSNRKLMQLNYIASHDLKTPVKNIEGLLEVLKEENMIADEGKCLIDMACSNLETMTDTIASLNKVISVQTELENMEMDKLHLSTIVDEVKGLLSTEIENTGTQIDEYFSTMEYVMFSKVHLVSVFQNMLTNSIKYQQKGNVPKISISSSVENGFAILEFKDNGIGMDLKRTEGRLFGLFQRFNDTYKGKGIGLHIVSSIIESVGGEIKVESELGVGTSFRVSIPI
ncbi:MAG: HAMP domain-containing histidine kinase [Flavobacteriales bacterium]|nr:HAMP domain-containing histidine kinase [Flavobacteriales bacterium]